MLREVAAAAALTRGTCAPVQANLARRMEIVVQVMRDVACQDSTSAVIHKLIAGTYELVAAERVTLFMVDRHHEVC